MDLKDYRHIVYCQSNGQGMSYLAIGVENQLVIKNSKSAFQQLEEYIDQESGWVFGYFSYDLKNDVEDLESKNTDILQFPEMIFFRPQLVLSISDNGKYTLQHDSENHSEAEIQAILQSINDDEKEQSSLINYEIKNRTSQTSYLQNVEDILSHIHRGDIYEMNYCQEFYIENINLNSWATYQQLNKHTQAPYSCYFRWKEFHLMCGSPELFLKKQRDKIISKPIKGTIRRGANKVEDELLINTLKTDQKEISENVMIVDIVRNDLSRTAMRNTVEVEELCKVYSYETVHQMISTVVSKVDNNTSPVSVIKNAFPMGSMTGAPKISAMKLIEKFEDFKRGLYSGAVGYFTPEGDFNFNVVIRSVAYNSEKKYCSMAAGGALTALSIPEKEYDETLLKADAMKKSIRTNE